MQERRVFLHMESGKNFDTKGDGIDTEGDRIDIEGDGNGTYGDVNEADVDNPDISGDEDRNDMADGGDDPEDARSDGPAGLDGQGGESGLQSCEGPADRTDAGPDRGGRELGPIILAHGVMGFDRIFFIHYFNGVVKHLCSKGYEVYSTKVSKTGSIAKRAGELKEAILAIPELKERLDLLMDPDDEAPSRPSTGGPDLPGGLNIIAHSMGGLDSRYMISKLGMARCTDTLTTISTPHGENPIMDLIASGMREDMKSIDLIKRLHIDLDAIKDLTTDSISELNEIAPNHPGVRYYSYGGAKNYIHRREFFSTPHRYLMDNFGANDGLITVDSSRWGTFLGIMEADHLEQIGWGNFLGLPENLRLPKSIKSISRGMVGIFNDGYFDHLAFFEKVADRLVELESELPGTDA